MNGLNEKLENESVPKPAKVTTTDNKKGTRGDIEDEDDEESYYRWVTLPLVVALVHTILLLCAILISCAQLHGGKSKCRRCRRNIRP